MARYFNDVDKITTNPIILLDIDGVLCAPEYFRTPNMRAIVALNRIIERTKPKFVISSSWKICEFKHDSTLAEIYLTSWGLHDVEVVGFTDGVQADCRIIDGRRLNGREEEILQWVEEFNPPNWCAIDDSITEGYRCIDCESLIGLTDQEADRVIKWLGYEKQTTS